MNASTALDREHPFGRCECADLECPANDCHDKLHDGHLHAWATTVVFRIDMDDETGTAMCEACAADALDSGLFTYPEVPL